MMKVIGIMTIIVTMTVVGWISISGITEVTNKKQAQIEEILNS